MSDSFTLHRIRDLKDRLEVEESSVEARTWWNELELLYLDSPEQLLSLLENLSTVGATFQEFHRAMALTDYLSIDEGMDILSRAKRFAGELPLDDSSLYEALNNTPFVMSAEEVTLWAEIHELKSALRFHQVHQTARDWWQTFEQDNLQRPELIKQLLLELRVRCVSLGEFFLSYVHSDTDNVQDNLIFLDLARNASRGRPLTIDQFREIPGGLFPAESLPYDRSIPSYAVWYYPESRTEQPSTQTLGLLCKLDEQSLDTEAWAIEELLDLSGAPEEVRLFWQEFSERCRSREARERRLILLRELLERQITLVEVFLAYQWSNLNLLQQSLNLIEGMRRLEGVEVLTLEHFLKHFDPESDQEG